MKYYLFILSVLFLNSCNNLSQEVKNMTSKDSINLSIQGSWIGDKKTPIWDIRPDSIFYYSENRSYYYFIHGNDMIVLYKSGPYKLENIRVTNDTLFFKIDALNAMLFKSTNTKSLKIKENHLVDEISHNNSKHKILGKWGYQHKEGIFSWVFTKDSIYYTQLNKWYFYVQHDNNVIVLSDNDPTVMKDIAVKSDTLFFTTKDNIIIKAHKIK
jgi:hypothetical protein